MYCIGAGSAAAAATTIVFSIAPFCSNFLTTAAIVDCFWPTATYIHLMPVSLWFMIASIPIAVFPVCLSPMISSLCPLPSGTILSMAFMPS